MALNTLTLGELNTTTATQLDTSTETVTTTNTILASENGKTFFLNAAGGFTSTLPTAAAGLRFTFIVKTNPTTAYIVAAATADTIVGWPSNIGGADSVADGNALGDQLNFAANTALAGDMAEFFSDGTYWYVRAHAKAINAITITG